jgi:hypothetical protein
MDFLELIIFLLGGILCGSILIVAYVMAAVNVLHKIDKDLDKNIELKKTE